MTSEPQSSSPGRPFRFLLVAVSLAGIAVGIGWAVGKFRPGRIEPPAAAAPDTDARAPDQRGDRGELVYAVYCASCHGPEGHGDGSSAAALRPPPRDFAARPWRFEPTSEAIRRATLEGIPGTGMASFRAALTPADLDAVVAHVYRLATTGPVVEKPPSEDERLLAAAGCANLMGVAPPALVLSDAMNRTVRLSDFTGQLVVLHFWGTNCTHCIKEIPTLNRLERQHAGRLKVLHVCADAEDPVVAQKLLDSVAPGATALTEANGLGLARYEVQSLPTVWLIAPDGTAIGRCNGARDWTAGTEAKLIAHWLPTASGPKPGGHP